METPWCVWSTNGQIIMQVHDCIPINLCQFRDEKTNLRVLNYYSQPSSYEELQEDFLLSWMDSKIYILNNLISCILYSKTFRISESLITYFLWHNCEVYERTPDTSVERCYPTDEYSQIPNMSLFIRL
jgi:hypothetical protein